MRHLPIHAVDPAAVETLLDRAFGRDRHARTAYLLRAGCAAVPGFSRAIVDRDELVATLHCWPVALARDDGGRDAMTLVGPVAVAPERHQAGRGRALMSELLDSAGPDAPLMLIGDPEYYDRFFGFSSAATGRGRLPGPVERRRLLARGRIVDAAGLVVPDPAA